MRLIITMLAFVGLLCSASNAQAEWKLKCFTDRMTDKKSCVINLYVSTEIEGIDAAFSVIVSQDNKKVFYFSSNAKAPITRNPFMFRIGKDPAVMCSDKCEVSENTLTRMMIESSIKKETALLRGKDMKTIEFPLDGFDAKYSEAKEFLGIK